MSDSAYDFTKFLVDRRGRVVERSAPSIEPAEIAPAPSRAPECAKGLYVSESVPHDHIQPYS